MGGSAPLATMLFMTWRNDFRPPANTGPVNRAKDGRRGGAPVP